MLLFGRGRQEVLVNAVTLGWVWKVQCSYQVPLSCLWIGMYFEASQCLWGTDTPLCRSEGRRDARRAFLVQQTELWKVRRMMGGEGGWGENEWAHIIFQLFPRWHFIITTLGGKTLHCKSWRRQDGFADAAGEGELSQHLWLTIRSTQKQGPAELMCL